MVGVKFLQSTSMTGMDHSTWNAVGNKYCLKQTNKKTRLSNPLTANTSPNKRMEKVKRVHGQTTSVGLCCGLLVVFPDFASSGLLHKWVWASISVRRVKQHRVDPDILIQKRWMSSQRSLLSFNFALCCYALPHLILEETENAGFQKSGNLTSNISRKDLNSIPFQFPHITETTRLCVRVFFFHKAGPWKWDVKIKSLNTHARAIGLALWPSRDIPAWSTLKMSSF